MTVTELTDFETQRSKMQEYLIKLKDDFNAVKEEKVALEEDNLSLNSKMEKLQKQYDSRINIQVVEEKDKS